MSTPRSIRTGAIAGVTAFTAMAGLYVGQARNSETAPERERAPVEAKAPPEEAVSRPGLLCLSLAGLRIQLGPVGESAYHVSTGHNSAGMTVYAEAGDVAAAADTVTSVLTQGGFEPVERYGPIAPPAVTAVDVSNAALRSIVAEEALTDEAINGHIGDAYEATPAHITARNALNWARLATDNALDSAYCDPVDV